MFFCAKVPLSSKKCTSHTNWKNRSTTAQTCEAHLDGEAGRVPAAGVGAVGSSLKGDCAGTLRGQHHVMVDPLTPVHQHVGQRGVLRYVAVVSEQHFM